ncbi:myosin-IIIb-like isoform X2 [Ostrea edulis]|uniref:myosin-IIIb-like isoform X2 n=1 Tax=Ostrea edulis TaxID=37623 RepID=UPI0024AFF9C5|nr:myosin-IIIb-like isoform X2 [Ostrea edulis]
MAVPEKVYGDDLAVLSDLTEDSLLKELNLRYERNIIYTYLGDVLVAVNPNKMIPIYGKEVGFIYSEAKLLQDLAPHIYAIASKAYRTLIWGRVNQAILVSGESGAGKTESTKMTLAQIARMSKSDEPTKVAEQIVEINPLLEAFGNAKTTINDNSSRFGKLIEVMFNKQGKLIGAKVTEHMLEKSRVIHCGNGERSFHIFYYMFAGLSENEVNRYYLSRPEHYRITDPGHATPVFMSKADYEQHGSRFAELKEGMNNTGFSPQTVDMIFAMMAGILHLSNIDFAPDPEIQQIIIVNEEEVDYSSRLLSLQAEDLVTVLLATKSFVRGERIMKMKSMHEACDGRDALCKALYSRLFSWIVKRVNEVLHTEDTVRPTDAGVISILDMAGFENFQVNSFEQLCINSANEQLQSFFNTYIFSWELQEYQTEGIKQPKIKFTNNKQILGLFFDRPVGIFAILEDDCRLQTSTDLSFVENMNREFVKNVAYQKSKSRDPVFTIVHYAGQVTYNATGFIEKNRETLNINFISLMQNSHNWLINDLFDDRQDRETRDIDKRNSAWTVPEWNQPNMPSLGPGETLSKRAGKKIKQRMNRDRPLPAIPSASGTTTSVHFRNSLSSLVENLKSSEPQFVRCIKANAEKQYGFFDAKLVQNQLRNSGVFETTKIRRLGFPTRLHMQDFINRYKAIAFPITESVEITAANCDRILRRAQIHGCEIGKSKVFLKYWQVDHLNMCMDKFLSDLRLVQTRIQMYLARKQFLEMMQYTTYCKDEVFILGNMVTKSAELFHVMVSTDDLDKNKYRKMLEEEEEENRRRNQRQSQHRRRGLPTRSEYSSYDYDRPDYDMMEGSYYNYNNRQSEYYRERSRYGPPSGGRPLYQIVEESLVHLYHKWDSIDPDAWCKIIYLEKDKVVQKFYILEREVTIDGKVGSEFDGERISLSCVRNVDRDDETANILSYVGQGVKLRKDMDGSITAVRLGKNPMIVKGYDNPSEHCFSLEVLNNEGRLPHHVPVKIFDMEEFKCQMGIQMKSNNSDQRVLRHQSVTGISLVKDEPEAGDTPCWMLIINLCALRAIDDPTVITHVEQKLAELANRTEEEKEIEMEKQEKNRELAARNKERKWSKLNPRQGVQGTEAPLRKTKLDLLKKGKTVGENLSYSWDIEAQKSKLVRNIEDLQEHFEEPESHIGGYRNSRQDFDGSVISSMLYTPGTGNSVRKDWAKIKVAIKQERRMDEETLQEITEEDE